MPELPEVETIKRGLQQAVVGYSVISIEIRLPKIFQGNSAKLIGKAIIGIRRFGKGLVIDFSDNLSLAVHVKMTGQLVFKENTQVNEIEGLVNLHPSLPISGNLPNKWTHIIFKLWRKTEKGEHYATLFYNDIRQFGWMKLALTSEIKELPFFKGLGPEPFIDLSENIFKTTVLKSNLPIKVLLMDQKRIAGVGNIYANDALFLACIDPRRKASSLSPKEIAKLYKSLLYVLEKGIEYGGASEINFMHVDGGKGFYQEHFLVYRQDKKPCSICGGEISRTTLGGRGTFFCKRCQV